MSEWNTRNREREREGGGRKKKRAIRAGGHKQSRKTNTQSCSGIPGSGFPIVLSIKTSHVETPILGSLKSTS